MCWHCCDQSFLLSAGLSILQLFFFFLFREGKLQKYSACFQEPNTSDTLDLF